MPRGQGWQPAPALKTAPNRPKPPHLSSQTGSTHWDVLLQDWRPAEGAGATATVQKPEAAPTARGSLLEGGRQQLDTGKNAVCWSWQWLTARSGASQQPGDCGGSAMPLSPPKPSCAPSVSLGYQLCLVLWPQDPAAAHNRILRDYTDKNPDYSNDDNGSNPDACPHGAVTAGTPHPSQLLPGGSQD